MGDRDDYGDIQPVRNIELKTKRRAIQPSVISVGTNKDPAEAANPAAALDESHTVVEFKESVMRTFCPKNWFQVGIVGVFLLAGWLSAPSRAMCQSDVQAVIGRAVEAGPQHKDVRDAIEVFRKGNTEGAIALLKNARKQDPQLSPAHVMLARIQFLANQIVAARASLEQAVIEASEDPEAYVILGELALRDSGWTSAQLLLKKGLSLCKDDQANAKRRDQLQIQCHAGLARLSEARRQWAEAELHLREWLKLDSENAAAHHRLGQSLFWQKQYDKAKQAFTAARSHSEQVARPEVSMGLMYERTGDQETARQYLESAAKNYPQEINTLLAVAQWALRSGSIDEALKLAQQALDVDGDSLPAQLLLGVSARHAHDYAAAEKTLRAIHNQAPTDFVATNNLALTLVALGDDQAKRQALEFAQLNLRANNDPRSRHGREAAMTLAWVLFQNGQKAAAVKALQSALKAGSVSAESAYYAAKILMDAKQRPLARTIIQAAVRGGQTFPYLDEAKQLIKDLESPDSSNG